MGKSKTPKGWRDHPMKGVRVEWTPCVPMKTPLHTDFGWNLEKLSRKCPEVNNLLSHTFLSSTLPQSIHLKIVFGVQPRGFMKISLYIC